MSSLVQINREYLEIIKAIEDNGGEITEQIETDIIKNLIQSKEKVSNYCLILDRYESEIDFMKNKVKEAMAFIDRLENQKEKLERIALSVVNARGSKLEGEGGSWINKRKSTSVEITNKDIIPPIYFKVEPKIDVKAIKEALNNGEKIDGAELKENESLQWK